jgi:hypothetical protein
MSASVPVYVLRVKHDVDIIEVDAVCLADAVQEVEALPDTFEVIMARYSREELQLAMKKESA